MRLPIPRSTLNSQSSSLQQPQPKAVKRLPSSACLSHFSENNPHKPWRQPSSSTPSQCASPPRRRWTRARSAPSGWVATATSSCTEATRPSVARSAGTSRCSSTPSARGRPPGPADGGSSTPRPRSRGARRRCPRRADCLARSCKYQQVLKCRRFIGWQNPDLSVNSPQKHGSVDRRRRQGPEEKSFSSACLWPWLS
jgi:hypothetical protein